MEDEGRDKNGRDIYRKILIKTHNYYHLVKYLENVSHLFFTYFNVS